MEEVLVEAVSDNCANLAGSHDATFGSNKISTSGTSPPSSSSSTTAAVAATTTVTIPGVAVGESSNSPRVLPMLYIHQGKLPVKKGISNNNNKNDSANGSPQVIKVVNKAQIASINHQIILKGLHPVEAVRQPITLQTRRVKVPATAQLQKHILLRKSDAPGAQIMQLSTAQDNQTNTQIGGKPGIAYVGTILKSKPRDSVVNPTVTSINASQIPKQKLVIAPVISQVSQTTSSTSNSSQNQSSKHMTNLVLPVSISQQSSVSVGKQNIDLKPISNVKINNGKVNSGEKNSLTVLKESKTSNASSNPPPLHPIAKMSLLNVPKNSSDSIKISENPDSAVITPIPKKDDNAEKRKKPFSNILRSTAEKQRIKKQTFPKSQDISVFDVPSRTLSSESEQERDKKTDKESDDDITLIRVIASEENKIRRALQSDEIRISIIKHSTRKDVELVEESEKYNGKSSDDDTKDQSSAQDSNFDATKALDWKDGVGSLPGSSLKFCMNEFGLMEVVEEDELKQEKNRSFGGKENVFVAKTSNKPSSSTVNEKKFDDKKITHKVSSDTFYCCQGCGCHGPASEFQSEYSCSPSCTEYIEVLRREKLRKEKEMNKDRIRKKRKKVVQEHQTKDRDKSNESSSKISSDFDDKSKDSEEKYEKLQDKYETDEDTKDTNTTLAEDESQEDCESKHPWLTGKLKFSWSKYLEHTKGKAAPVKLFKEPFPYGKNNFKVGMKLEGIDPNHPSHYCVLTVAEVVGYRIRLHFDGFPENFDFWVNADSIDIFPVGWAEKNGHKLQPPKGYVQTNFNWHGYLKICKATAAPKHLFMNKSSMALPTGFRVGMKLEAVDRKHSSLVCVASVADLMDSRILVHFDSWDDVYDYWADVSSPYIHPIGWCHHNGRELTPPNYYKDPKSFSWDAYLRAHQAIATPARAFKQRPPCGFKRGMKLEAVDKRLPQLIRVATIEDVKDHMIKIRFDGWPENHAYWVDDDSLDIHPKGWCSQTGHPLEPPLTQDNLNDRPECGTYGCRGIGHVRGPKFATHNSASGCPYSPQNLNKIKTITDRLSLKHEVNDVEDEYAIPEKIKHEKPDRAKLDRSQRRTSLYDSLNEDIKMENIKQEDSDSSDKIEKMESSERLSRWRNHSDNHADDNDVIRKKKKRKHINGDSSLVSNHNSTQDSTANANHTCNIPDKQLRLELYHSVYNPGYNPLPDAPHIWAKHSNALNRVVAKQNTNPRRWSNEEVIKFIQSVPNCKEIGSNFRKHNIDGESFLMLTQEDLVSILGLRLGPAIKLYNSIVLLRKKAT